MMVTFKEENLLTFKHLFLKNYADGDTENYAVYRQADVYDYISYAITQVNEHHLTCNGRELFFSFTCLLLEIIVGHLLP